MDRQNLGELSSFLFLSFWTLAMLLHSRITPQPDAIDTTLTFILFTDVWCPSRTSGRQRVSSLCTAHIAPVLRRFPLMHGSGAGIPGIVVLIYSWHCGIGILSGDGICSRSWDAETSARWANCTDWNSSTVVEHCDERSDDRTHGSRENENRAQRAWESESQNRTHLAKTLTTGTLHSTDTRVCSILLILPC